MKGEDVGDRVLEQATDALGDSDEHGNGDDLGLENLFAEMTEICPMVMKRVLMF